MSIRVSGVCVLAEVLADLDGIWHIVARALSAADVQPLLATRLVQQIAELLIVDLQQLHSDVILHLQTNEDL